MRIAAILVAGGTGTRFGAAVPKQFCLLAGKPVIRHAAEALADFVSLLQPVGQTASIDRALAGMTYLPPVPGGATRQASVLAGLEALAPHAPDIVLVHDAARPVIPVRTIPSLVAALGEAPGAIPGLPIGDTIKQAADDTLVGTVPREGLFRAQTPQAFRFATLYSLARASVGQSGTDDAYLLEQAGLKVVLVAGSARNIKVTYPEDLHALEQTMSSATPHGPGLPRIGTGFDVHAFAPDRDLVLCGVRVPHALGLAGHSDADVGIHALCDAIYGALAEGDIGRHFPPSDAEWQDADSARFLRHAAARVAARGGTIGNVDVTLICEAPKISPHVAAMRARIADLLGIDIGGVSVKATTTERLGFAGRGEGIAAQAAAVILLTA